MNCRFFLLKIARLGLFPFGLLLMAGMAHARPEAPVHTAETVAAVCQQMVENAGDKAAAIRRVKPKQASVKSVLVAWDELERSIEDPLGPIYLQTYVHPNKAVRDAGEACIVRARALETELFQDKALYDRVLAVPVEDAIDAKLRQDLLDRFDDTGVSLDEASRRRAKQILERIEALAQEFSRNLRENQERLRFTAAEIVGLPRSYLDRVEHDADGGIIVGFDYPDYLPFMTHARDRNARERYYRGFVNRGGERNLEILGELSELRKELAELHELPSYAHYVTRRRMVRDPETVQRFLDDVEQIVNQVEPAEIAELRALAQPLTQYDADTELKQWDKEFLLERLRNERYAIDQETLRSYFPTLQTLEWVLLVSSRLYGLRFEQAEVPVWHSDVMYYDVLDEETGDFLGGIYLDLYPRAGKYGHAAAFSVRGSSTRIGRTPITALVMNFNRQGLTHDEVETFLHEFGHALHGVLSRTRYVFHAGTQVEQDFVEAPSQMYEAWARRPESLALMGEVCEACPSLDEDLIKRIQDARRVGQGIFYGRQKLYASYDLALTDADPGKPLPVWRRMEADTPWGYPSGTEFPGTFAHIAGGYAAGYYGYMWAEALALDMLSEFGDNVMDPEVGRRFREAILSRGGEVQAQAMVRDFLGRSTDTDALFAEIRGEETPALSDDAE